MWLGDFTEDFANVTCMFTTHSSTGAPVAPDSAFEAADVVIFKNGSATEKTTTNGLTMTSPFNGTTGLHCLVIDTSNDTGDSGFWVAGAVYTVILASDETVDGVAVAKVIGQFGIELAGALRPTTAGRKLDVSAGGEAGLDWANIGSPTTTVGLSGTTVKTATDVETDTADIQSRLPAALVSGRIDASVGAMATGVLTASAIDANAITDAKVASDVTIASVIGSVGSVAGNVDGSIGSLSTQARADVNAEADAALADAGVTTIVTGRIDAAVSTRATQTSVDTVDDFLDTEIAAIKAKTDNLPADPADASDISGAFSTVNSTLATIATYIDTEVGAIKTKTDQLTFGVANTLNANVTHVNEVEVAGDGDATSWGPA